MVAQESHWTGGVGQRHHLMILSDIEGAGSPFEPPPC
jgi:hypothetical protein